MLLDLMALLVKMIIHNVFLDLVFMGVPVIHLWVHSRVLVPLDSTGLLVKMIILNVFHHLVYTEGHV